MTTPEEKRRMLEQLMLELYYKYLPKCRTKTEICKKIGSATGKSDPTVFKYLKEKVEFPPPHITTDETREYIRQVYRELLEKNQEDRRGLLEQTAEITGWSTPTTRRALGSLYQPPEGNYKGRGQRATSSEGREKKAVLSESKKDEKGRGEQERREEEGEDDEREERVYLSVEVSEELQRKILVQHKKYSNPLEVRYHLNLRGEHCTLEQVLAVFVRDELSTTSPGKKSSEPY